jgi:hypothetical protein
MHPESSSVPRRLRLLPPWVVLHFANATSAVPAELRDQFLLAANELEREAALRHDSLALELFLNSICVSPNVRSLVSSLVVDVTAPLADDPDRAQQQNEAIPQQTREGRLLRRPLTPDEAHLLAQRHVAHDRRLQRAAGEAVDRFGGCLLLDCRTFVAGAQPEGAPPAPPTIQLGTDPTHTPQHLVDAFRTALTAAGYAVEVDSQHRGAVVPNRLYGREPLLYALRIAVDRRLGDGNGDALTAALAGPSLRAALCRALDLWQQAAPDALPAPCNRGIHFPDPMLLFSVDDALQLATPRVTAALPTPLPEQALAELQQLPPSLMQALSLELVAGGPGAIPTAVRLKRGLDACNAAALALGAPPRFVPTGDVVGLPSSLPAETVQAYRDTVFRVESAVRTQLRVGTNHVPLHTFFALYGTDSCAFVTAVNPRGQALDPTENQRRHAELRSVLEQRRCTHFEGVGAHPSNGWPPEPGILVFGLGLDEARGLGRRFDQDAIVWAGVDTRVRLVLLR